MKHKNSMTLDDFIFNICIRNQNWLKGVFEMANKLLSKANLVEGHPDKFKLIPLRLKALNKNKKL